jgi:large conductance mechanosensitive channel
MFAEFKAFINKGSVIDLAVAFILATTFAAVIKSLVDDIIMPPIGYLFGGVDFANLFVALNGQSYPSVAAAKDAGAATINYGLFINTIITFLIVAFVLFLIVRAYNRARGYKDVPMRDCPYCLTSIPAAASKCASCTAEVPAVMPSTTTG